MKVGLFFGSNGGNTEDVSNQLAEEMNNNGFEVEVYDIANCSVDDILNYDTIIIASSTWNDGELQDDWDAVIADYEGLDFSGKKVGFLGLGDQDGYAENFVDAIGILANPVRDTGAEIFGRVPKENYDYEMSVAEDDDGKLVGLAIDVDNEEDKTEERIKAWVAQIKEELGV